MTSYASVRTVTSRLPAARDGHRARRVHCLRQGLDAANERAPPGETAFPHGVGDTRVVAEEHDRCRSGVSERARRRALPAGSAPPAPGSSPTTIFASGASVRTSTTHERKRVTPTGVAAQTPTMTSASTAKRTRSRRTGLAAQRRSPRAAPRPSTIDVIVSVRESLDDRARPRPAGCAPTPRRKADRRAHGRPGRPASPRRRRRARRCRARPRRSRSGGSVRPASPSRAAIDGRDIVGVDEHSCERRPRDGPRPRCGRHRAARRPRRCAAFRTSGQLGVSGTTDDSPAGPRAR